MVLTTNQAQEFYDKFGAKQDQQGFYEDRALDALVAAAAFGDSRTTFEFGCGTGRFAERLLAGELLADGSYVGCDLSVSMTGLARSRLARFGSRSLVYRSGANLSVCLDDRSVDRVVSTYVLDLLDESAITEFLAEAHRVLRGSGRLCLVGLTEGAGLLPRLVSTVWDRIYRLSPSTVGGCRPMRVEKLLDPGQWDIVHLDVVVAWGISSEVLIAAPKNQSTTS